MMKLVSITLFLLIVLASGCASEKPMEKITIKAEDGTVIVSNYFNSENPKANVILLHMLNRNKNDWNDFARELQKKNFAVLAIDFRGHGESHGELKTGIDFQKMVLDVKAANYFLNTEHPNTKAHIVGASIGANAGLQFAAQNPSANVTKLVLLSPGLDYKGIVAKEFIEIYHNDLFLAATKEDVYAFNSAHELFQSAATPDGKRTLNIEDGVAHGTNLLKDERFKLKLLQWIEL